VLPQVVGVSEASRAASTIPSLPSEAVAVASSELPVARAEREATKATQPEPRSTEDWPLATAKVPAQNEPTVPQVVGTSGANRPVSTGPSGPSQTPVCQLDSWVTRSRRRNLAKRRQSSASRPSQPPAPTVKSAGGVFGPFGTVPSRLTL